MNDDGTVTSWQPNLGVSVPTVSVRRRYGGGRGSSGRRCVVRPERLLRS
ncbi:MAG: hypothetical protein AVDCRST_MAG66-2847 [uncultured Pseudonocardia sp.]|uniref:Uncharacterized protein n=1 Tax=uncultured Pseudonocardia sp. TaxID=211455 RepID=A0A6J4PU18_9PSEU|nr:MAG: hypothetical protein AVDCRST_MAG66-2847 [uncultured Pseudonocardia sp.]